jgi:hypothetical protein
MGATECICGALQVVGSGEILKFSYEMAENTWNFNDDHDFHIKLLLPWVHLYLFMFQLYNKN